MSWFSSSSNAEDAKAQNFWPITTYAKEPFGKLTEQDTTWACLTNKGFRSETQIWYSVLEDGSILLVQVIWSYLGVMFVPATAQFVFKLYDPKTKKSVWRSINSSGFKANGRGCKAHEFEIKHTGTPDGEETYTITGSFDKTTQISLTLTRPASAPGFKYGDGPDGAYSIYGKNREEASRDGIVVHRFHPLVKSSGSLVVDGKIVDAKGEAIFIHAIQGMRPDSVARRWNFAFFTTGGGKPEGKLGSVRAVQMELETPDTWGPAGAKSGNTKVNIGALYATGLSTSPFVVTGQTHLPATATASYPESTYKSISTAEQHNTAKDSDTGYDAPGGITFTWKGPRRDGEAGDAGATLTVDKLDGQAIGGLIEKVDVLSEIPYVIRKGLAGVTGIKPYIYQYMNSATLNVELGDEKIPVDGWLFNEASFVST